MIHLDLKNWTYQSLKPYLPSHRKFLQLPNTVTMTTNNPETGQETSSYLWSTSSLGNLRIHSAMCWGSAMSQAFNTHTSFNPNHENRSSEKKVDQGYTTRVRPSQGPNPSLSDSKTQVLPTEPYLPSHWDSYSVFPPCLAFSSLLIILFCTSQYSDTCPWWGKWELVRNWYTFLPLISVLTF